MLQRQLLVQGKYYNLFKRRKKSFTRSSYFDTKKHLWTKKTKRSMQEIQRKAQFCPILDSSRVLDEEFRRNQS
jgi:hypothetical protein